MYATLKFDHVEAIYFIRDVRIHTSKRKQTDTTTRKHTHTHTGKHTHTPLANTRKTAVCDNIRARTREHDNDDRLPVAYKCD